MRLYVGTSGFAYKAWRGGFYPGDLGERETLAYYARQFNSVEINSTFYRFPTPALLAQWAEQVPKSFRFAIKAPRRITHIKRLEAIDEELLYLVDTVTTLGPRLGPLLFQLPPNQAKALDRCEHLFDLLPPNLAVAMEFRHPSWFSGDVYALLADHNAAVCFNDTLLDAPVGTADWGYLRRRRAHYNEAQFATMADDLLHQPWRQTYVFFKHEESAETPLDARRWAALARAALERPGSGR